jgi:hypothetical protein
MEADVSRSLDLEAWASALPDKRKVINLAALLSSGVAVESLIGREGFVPHLQVGVYPQVIRSAWTQEDIAQLEANFFGPDLDAEPHQGAAYSSGLITETFNMIGWSLFDTEVLVESYGFRCVHWVWVLLNSEGELQDGDL